MSSKGTATIIISGGGTGGHYYPAMAIAEAIQRLSGTMLKDIRVDCHYVGSAFGIERRLAPGSGLKYTLLPVKGFSRYFSVRAFLQNLLLPFRLIKAWLITLVLYRQKDPVATVVSGGYAAAVPGYISGRRHIPLFVQEQNAFPGVTSRMLSKHAMAFFYAYDEVKAHIRHDVLFIKSGNPVRSNIISMDKYEARKRFGLDTALFTLLIFGGSQGSLSINTYIAKRIESWIYKYEIQVLWQTGEASYPMLKRDFAEHNHIHLLKYIDDMAAAYSAADMVISRAGALSLAEIQKMRLPAILVPLPGAAGNHQYHNAKALESRECAFVVEEKDFPENPFTPHLNDMINDPEKLPVMRDNFPKDRENAAEKIAASVINHLRAFYAWS
ncbi:MAG: UDP-N-acetylglucosamine--N-acetylmuramyl-(pentapeptide) pyrophosphoryl-undecaprenol N-acetylglucosamine transferase [Candidatus Marinimicrobia bacterium]|nr:UDP-N-acetylglucosamine--N-acetylmuramyl-(pentapeptide) pyrophosphoryl-undecaprenol N-acetylglucosamine transferase [Candidatus Neomarinimicrobiota bacterium]